MLQYKVFTIKTLGPHMFRTFSLAHPQGPTEKSRRVLKTGCFICKKNYILIKCICWYIIEF
jgi:hypothetical protein